MHAGNDATTAAPPPLPSSPQGQFADQYHTGNTCTSADGSFYSFSGCVAVPFNLNTTVYVTADNTLLADPGKTFSQTCNEVRGGAA
jgi:hypothetical protein